eukprot:403361364
MVDRRMSDPKAIEIVQKSLAYKLRIKQRNQSIHEMNKYILKAIQLEEEPQYQSPLNINRQPHFFQEDLALMTKSTQNKLIQKQESEGMQIIESGDLSQCGKKAIFAQRSKFIHERLASDVEKQDNNKTQQQNQGKRNLTVKIVKQETKDFYNIHNKSLPKIQNIDSSTFLQTPTLRKKQSPFHARKSSYQQKKRPQISPLQLDYLEELKNQANIAPQTQKHVDQTTSESKGFNGQNILTATESQISLNTKRMDVIQRKQNSYNLRFQSRRDSLIQQLNKSQSKIYIGKLESNNDQSSGNIGNIVGNPKIEENMSKISTPQIKTKIFLNPLSPQIKNQASFILNKSNRSLFHPQKSQSPITSPRDKSELNISQIRQELYMIQQKKRERKKQKVQDLQNKPTLREDQILNLFNAKIKDQKQEMQEQKAENFKELCMTLSINGRLKLNDQGLGFGSAQELCLILMDPNCYISHLDLSQNPLGDEGVIILMHAIKRSKSLIYLNLSSTDMTQKDGSLKNSIGIQSLEYLKELFKVNQFIQFLDLSNNRFGNQGLKIIASAIINSETLISLSIQRCDIDSKSASVLQELFMKFQVKYLDISKNKILNIGSQALAKSLLDNKSSQLTQLSIADCGINGMNGFTCIFQPIGQNRNVLSLTVDNNVLDYNCCATLSYALRTNKSLRTLSLNNCDIDDRCMNYLIDMLANNYNLLHLYLGHNQIGMESMRRFNDMFYVCRRNLSLKTLDLQSNLIDDEGGYLLAQGISNYNDLNKIILRNNSVCIKTVSKLIDVLKTTKFCKLTHIDLEYNLSVPQRLINDITSMMAQNRKHQKRIQQRAMNYYKQLMNKIDCQEELSTTNLYLDNILEQKSFEVQKFESAEFRLQKFKEEQIRKHAQLEKIKSEVEIQLNEKKKQLIELDQKYKEKQTIKIQEINAEYEMRYAMSQEINQVHHQIKEVLKEIKAKQTSHNYEKRQLKRELVMEETKGTRQKGYLDDKLLEMKYFLMKV